MKKILALLMVCAMMLSLCACGATDKVFTCGDLSITLNSNFKESSIDNQDAYYESDKVGVTVVQDAKSNLANGNTMTKKDYAELVIELYNKNVIGSVTEVGGLTYFTYTAVIDSTGYTYQTYVFETVDSFWMVQFFCHTSNYDKCVSNIQKWASSVVFNTTTDNTDTVATTAPQVIDTSKTFVCGDVTLTLDNTFEESEVAGQDAAYMSDSIGVTVLSQSRSELTQLGYKGDTMTTAEYAALIIEANELNSEGVKEDNGLTTYTYTASTTNYNFTYQSYILENDENFYMIQFYCVSGEYALNAPSFSQWASQIVIG